MRWASLRLRALTAAPLVVLAGGSFVAVHAGGIPTAKALTILNGSAGASALMHLSKPTSLNNAGGDVTLSAPGSMAVGVGLVRIDHHQIYADKSYYVETYGTDLGMCNSSRCPVPLPVRAYAWGAQDEGPLRLSAGDYLVVLLAEPGTHVTARIQLRGQPAGVLHQTVRGARLGQLVVDKAAGSVAGHDLVSRGYHMHYAKARLIAGQMGMFSFASPGTLDYQQCGDSGDGPPPNGPTACMQGGGAEPYPVVAANVGDTVVGTGAQFATGTRNGHYGMGYTISVGGPDPTVQRIRVADYQIVLGQ